MSDILQKIIGMNIEYEEKQENIKINMGESGDNFYTKLDEIKINPKIANINNLEIKKTGIKMNLSAPIICRTQGLETNSTMMAGIKFEGKGKAEFVEKIEEKARSFGPGWEKAVEKRKAEIISRMEKQ